MATDTVRLRCQALDANGKRCRCTKNLTNHRYHGDSELYSNSSGRPQWVQVLICEKCYAIYPPKGKS